jgi:acyl-CoA synthetase (AMP-forming)/AMP-acid ligase II
VDRPFARRCGFLRLQKRAVLIDPDGRKPAPGDAQRDQGNEVAIGEAGEIIARGPQIMPGYWRQPGETGKVLRDGWLFTGDIGKMDGWLFHHSGSAQGHDPRLRLQCLSQ